MMLWDPFHSLLSSMEHKFTKQCQFSHELTKSNIIYTSMNSLFLNQPRVPATSAHGGISSSFSWNELLIFGLFYFIPAGV